LLKLLRVNVLSLLYSINTVAVAGLRPCAALSGVGTFTVPGNLMMRSIFQVLGSPPKGHQLVLLCQNFWGLL
jgi:hypothetical protein